MSHAEVSHILACEAMVHSRVALMHALLREWLRLNDFPEFGALRDARRLSELRHCMRTGKTYVLFRLIFGGEQCDGYLQHFGVGGVDAASGVS